MSERLAMKRHDSMSVYQTAMITDSFNRYIRTAITIRLSDFSLLFLLFNCRADLLQ